MKKKEWTVLMYLNGSNEMSPEMKNTFNQVKEIRSEDIQIAIEIGQAPSELVKLIREDVKCDEINSWSGVRRYYIYKGENKLIEDLGKINMADYKNLYQFITWGIKTYPAKRYMLVISGHGFLVLSLSDFCTDRPYMMGMYELIYAVNSIYEELKSKIDILVMDICNMNVIESYYELGKKAKNTVDYVITYIDYGPLEGMDYRDIIGRLSFADTEEILNEIITNSEVELIAAKINHNKLAKIKTLISKNAFEELADRVENSQTSSLSENYQKQIEKIIRQLILTKDTNTDFNKLTKIIVSRREEVKDIEAFMGYYQKLAFSKNNYWTNIVARKGIDESIDSIQVKPVQYVLSLNNLLAVIAVFNPNKSKEQLEQTVQKIYKYNEWNGIFKE